MSEKNKATRVVDVANLENYLALWVAIKGVAITEQGFGDVTRLSKEEYERLGKKYLTVKECLRLFGLKTNE